MYISNRNNIDSNFLTESRVRTTLHAKTHALATGLGLLRHWSWCGPSFFRCFQSKSSSFREQKFKESSVSPVLRAGNGWKRWAAKVLSLFYILHLDVAGALFYAWDDLRLPDTQLRVPARKCLAHRRFLGGSVGLHGSAGKSSRKKFVVEDAVETWIWSLSELSLVLWSTQTFANPAKVVILNLHHLRFQKRYRFLIIEATWLKR